MDGWHPSCTQGPVSGLCQCVSHSCLHMITKARFPVLQTPAKSDALGREWEIFNHSSSKQGRTEAQCGSGQITQLTGCPCLVLSGDRTGLSRGGRLSDCSSSCLGQGRACPDSRSPQRARVKPLLYRRTYVEFMNEVAVQGPEDSCMIGLDMQTVEGQSCHCSGPPSRKVTPLPCPWPFLLHFAFTQKPFLTPFPTWYNSSLASYASQRPLNTRTHCVRYWANSVSGTVSTSRSLRFA